MVVRSTVVINVVLNNHFISSINVVRIQVFEPRISNYEYRVRGWLDDKPKESGSV